MHIFFKRTRTSLDSKSSRLWACSEQGGVSLIPSFLNLLIRRGYFVSFKRIVSLITCFKESALKSRDIFLSLPKLFFTLQTSKKLCILIDNGSILKLVRTLSSTLLLVICVRITSENLLWLRLFILKQRFILFSKTPFCPGKNRLYVFLISNLQEGTTCLHLVYFTRARNRHKFLVEVSITEFLLLEVNHSLKKITTLPHFFLFSWEQLQGRRNLVRLATSEWVNVFFFKIIFTSTSTRKIKHFLFGLHYHVVIHPESNCAEASHGQKMITHLDMFILYACFNELHSRFSSEQNLLALWKRSCASGYFLFL